MLTKTLLDLYGRAYYARQTPSKGFASMILTRKQRMACAPKSGPGSKLVSWQDLRPIEEVRMNRKLFAVEQIIRMFREAEVHLSQRKCRAGEPGSRDPQELDA